MRTVSKDNYMHFTFGTLDMWRNQLKIKCIETMEQGVALTGSQIIEIC